MLEPLYSRPAAVALTCVSAPTAVALLKWATNASCERCERGVEHGSRRQTVCISATIAFPRGIRGGL